MMRQAAVGWCGLAGYVVAWDRLCRKGETLSAGADDAHDRHPWLTLAGAVYTVAHLFGWLPPELDAFKLITLERGKP